MSDIEARHRLAAVAVGLDEAAESATAEIEQAWRLYSEFERLQADLSRRKRRPTEATTG